MHAFFKGRRRKAGCGLLMLAVALMFAWVGSYLGVTTFNVIVWQSTLYGLHATDGMLFWGPWYGSISGVMGGPVPFWAIVIPLTYSPPT